MLARRHQGFQVVPPRLPCGQVLRHLSGGKSHACGVKTKEHAKNLARMPSNAAGEYRHSFNEAAQCRPLPPMCGRESKERTKEDLHHLPDFGPQGSKLQGRKAAN